ncbi:unnamed protein product [Adineta steineri]|uniref:EF-hand domain-containing protein n=1 Tax=Adineta steineri TaxID=433720 RepID=A0A813YGK8_9BILA|nr:unnamed protein product [Adineta steineri]CAF1041926.1 unnamed protein product [Adineta steineri]
MLTKAFVTSKINDTNGFNDISQDNGEDFWRALQGPIFSRLYNINITASNVSYGYIFNENKILGVPRLRQVRIQGYTDDDIKKIINKYDKNNDGNLDEEEQKQMKHDLDIGQIKIDDNHDDNKSGVILLIIGMGSFKTISLFKYQSSTKRRRYQYIDNDKNNLQNSHVAIQVNPFSQLNNSGSYQQYSTILPLDDDDELIQSDISSISASIFCETSLIELRLDQDTEYDNDLADEDNN